MSDFNAGVRAVMKRLEEAADLNASYGIVGAKTAEGMLDARSLAEELLRPEPEPVAWGWWLRDLTAPPGKDGFLVRNPERLAIATHREEWEITPLYTHPAPTCTAQTGPAAA